MKTYEVKVGADQTKVLEAEYVTERWGWVMFRVKGTNVGRFPAASTTFREVEREGGKE